MSLPTPYYDDGKGIVIYHADCRTILPDLEPVDLVLTDPPYPTWMQAEYSYEDGLLEAVLQNAPLPQMVFWTPSVPFPLDYSAVHVWDKATGTNTQYELVYCRGLTAGYKIYRYMSPHNSVRAQWCGDVCVDHANQKPVQLITALLKGGADTILDPFMGSGTTLRAAKDLGRKCIGIEIEEKYCAIAVKRLAQEVFEFDGTLDKANAEA